MITRAEILWRATHLWAVGSVPYSQSSLASNGYRQDCSGFVSMCWALDTNAFGWGGGTTVTLVTSGVMGEIPRADCQPGDAVGICGPGTGGDAGHVVLFDCWYNNDPNDDRFWVWEQAGGTSGPLHRVWNFANMGAEWRAWRYKNINGSSSNIPSSGGSSMALEGQQAKDVADAGFVARSVPSPEGGGNVGMHVAAAESWSHSKAADDQSRKDLVVDETTLAELRAIASILVTINKRLDGLLMPPADMGQLARVLAPLVVDQLFAALAERMTLNQPNG